MRRTSQTPTEDVFKSTLAAVISLLTAVGFLLIGLWSRQQVFVFMAGSILLISAGEVLSPRHSSWARAAKWVGRGGVLVGILYILIVLLPGD